MSINERVRKSAQAILAGESHVYHSLDDERQAESFLERMSDGLRRLGLTAHITREGPEPIYGIEGAEISGRDPDNGRYRVGITWYR